MRFFFFNAGEWRKVFIDVSVEEGEGEEGQRLIEAVEAAYGKSRRGCSFSCRLRFRLRGRECTLVMLAANVEEWPMYYDRDFGAVVCRDVIVRGGTCHIGCQHLLHDEDMALDKFQMLGRLGSSGQVYECQHIETEKKMACKIIRCNSQQEQSETLSLYARLRSAGSDYQCDCLCCFIGAFAADPGKMGSTDVALLMPKYEGSLFDLMANKGKDYFTEDVAVDVAHCVLKALSWLHTPAVGLVHRDVKPSNIFYVPVGHAPGEFFVLGDLEASRDIRNKTHVTGGTGTFAYIAPETLMKYEATVKSDVWSLGVLLHQLCSNNGQFLRQPLPMHAVATQANFAAQVQEHTKGSALSGLVQQMLQVDVDRRVSVAQALAQVEELRKEKKLGSEHCKCSMPSAHNFRGE